MTARSAHAAALGVPPDAPPDAARSAVVRRLPGEGFAPPDEWFPAANALAGAALPVPADTDDLAEDLGAFVAGYWAFPPAERHARWEGLAARAAGTRFDGRVRHLAAGLGVAADGPDGADPDAAELGQRVREWFRLPPRERAVVRAEWQADRADEPGRWATAARRVRESDPGAAALDPGLIDRLRLYEPLSAVVSGAGTGVYRAEPLYPLVVAPRPSSTESVGGRAAGFLVIFGLIAVVRLISAGLSSSDSPNSAMPKFDLPPFPTAPAFTPPPNSGFPDRPLDPAVIQAVLGKQPAFSAAELAAFKEYESTRIGTPPPRFSLWKLAQAIETNERRTKNPTAPPLTR